MTSSRRALALLLLTVVGLSQTQAEPINDDPTLADIELEAMFESPDNKFELTKLFAGQYYENTYKKINDYLVDHLETSNPEANLKFALEWLNNEKAKSSSSNNLIEALTQFTSLLKTNNRCDRVAYAILVKNDRATNHVTHTYVQPATQRRIDGIVHYYAFKHARECIAKLPELYENKLTTMDQGIVQKLENSFDKELLTREHKISAWELLFHLTRGNMAQQRYLRKIRNEKTGKLEVDETKLKQVIEHSLNDLRAPCEYFVNELGPDVFIPASYDFQMYQSVYRESTDKVNKAIRRFKHCKIVLRSQEKLFSEVKAQISKFQ